MRWGLTPALVLPVLVLSALLAACGGASTAVAPSPATAGAAVSRSYDTVLDLADPSLDPKVADIQEGASVRNALRQVLASPLAAVSDGAVVNRTTILGPVRCRSASVPSPCALVIYEVLSPTSGGGMDDTDTGYATDLDGRWVLAKVTICDLLALFWQATHDRGAPPGCPGGLGYPKTVVTSAPGGASYVPGTR